MSSTIPRINIGTLNLAALQNATGYFAEEHRSLRNLGAVNLFVGANNVGKSRLLRAIFAQQKLSYRPIGFDHTKLRDALSQFAAQLKRELSAINITKYGELTPDSFESAARTFEWLTEGDAPLSGIAEYLKGLVEAETPFQKISYEAGRSGAHRQQIEQLHRKLGEPAKQLLEILAPHIHPIAAPAKTYIPVLRGLRPLAIETDSYAERTRQDYQLQGGSNVFTGLSMYADLRKLLLGTTAHRERVRKYEQFLQTNIFDGRAVTLTPQEPGDVIHVHIDGQSERPIYACGDGIQSLIVMTFPAFTAPTPQLFFVEEPELQLHPGMQRKMLELFLSEPTLRRHQYFATTHSNHLLDIAADYTNCSLYVFRKAHGQPDLCEVRRAEPADRLLLGEIGARASSVFLTNATIWVEGITDRKYIRSFLNKFMSTREPKLRQDTHYSFMEAGGSNVAHFDFEQSAAGTGVNVTRICSANFVVLDGDNAGKPRAQKLLAALNENVMLLESKEIENLLPVEALRSYAKNHRGLRERSDVDFDKLKLNDYHKTMDPLGKVMDKKLNTDVFEKDQSIQNKMGVCDSCTEFLDESADAWTLTPEAEQLCARIYSFVLKANGLTEISQSAVPSS